MKLLSLCSCFIAINPSFALDIDKAWKNNKFHDIESNSGQWIVHPERFPSVSLYFDKYRRPHHDAEFSSDWKETYHSGSEWTTKKIEITLGNL